MTTVSTGANRVCEIENRLNAATPGPWEEYWQGHIHAPANYPQAAAISICQTFGREDRRHPNADFIAHSPADVAYLLAELRKRDEVIAKLSDWAGRSKSAYYDEAQDDVVQIIKAVL